MNICPITYKPCGNKKYSEEGLHLLSKNLKELNDLPLTQEELLREAAIRSVKMSIQGVQPKLSAKLRPRENKFEIVDCYGEYILKPQSNFYREFPKNEDLTMRLASLIEIEIPLHGLVYSIDGNVTYFIKRFDRYAKYKKLSLEDFAQLAGKSREIKYDYSMEKLVTLIETFCTFPLIEKVKLFRLTIFNFITGNEDMHLKNYSLITRDEKVELSPAYDLLNTTIAMPGAQEEIALSLSGKKRNLNAKILIDYWGREKLKLNNTIIFKVLDKISDAWNEWERLINVSFLSKEMKEKYYGLLMERKKRLGI
ncbi:MAG: HipA domain-containing protein [Bacteroidota bacterium]